MDLIEKAASKLRRSADKSLVERVADKIEDKPLAGPRADDRRPAEKPGRPGHPGKGGAGSEHQRVHIDLAGLSARGFITKDQEPTQIAEEFRIIKRALLNNAFRRDGSAIRDGNLILVNSAQPSEGKTFCAINLAMSIAAERDLTVLLVDADFARPSILKVLGIKGDKGLVDVIDDDNIDVGDCLMRTNVENLVLLPAGRRHNLTTELLASERMRQVVDEIKMRYNDRVIIFDSPPALASSAPGALASLVGQVLFVVEADRTSTVQIKNALMHLESCPSVSIILNKNRNSEKGSMFGKYYYDYNTDDMRKQA